MAARNLIFQNSLQFAVCAFDCNLKVKIHLLRGRAPPDRGRLHRLREAGPEDRGKGGAREELHFGDRGRGAGVRSALAAWRAMAGGAGESER